jgi:hypothetical protein
MFGACESPQLALTLQSRCAGDNMRSALESIPTLPPCQLNGWLRLQKSRLHARGTGPLWRAGVASGFKNNGIEPSRLRKPRVKARLRKSTPSARGSGLAKAPSPASLSRNRVNRGSDRAAVLVVSGRLATARPGVAIAPPGYAREFCGEAHSAGVVL